MCFFKGEHHTVTTCKARKGCSALGQEHRLSSNTPDVSTLLRDRIRLSMPVRVSPHGEKLLTEPWFDIQYWQIPLSQENVQSWQAALQGDSVGPQLLLQGCRSDLFLQHQHADGQG